MRVLQRLRERKEWLFFAALPKADGRLAFAWWAVVLLHGILPALFADLRSDGYTNTPWMSSPNSFSYNSTRPPL